MAEGKPRWLALGALGLAAIAAFALSRKTEAPTVLDAGVSPLVFPTSHATVSLFDDGAPMAGRTVVFHDASGRVLTTTKSGADGKATGPMPSHGLVTVAYGTSLKQLVTIAGVEPNDDVLVGEKDNDEESTGDTSAIARIGLPGAHPNAARYAVELGVGTNSVLDAGAPVRLPVMRRYLDESRHFHVLGLALDADGGALAYAHASVLAADAGDTDVKLPAWKTDFRQQRMRIVHPRGFTSVKADFDVHAGEARFDHRESAPLHDPDTNLAFDVVRELGTSATYRVEVATAGATSDRAILVRRDAKMTELVLLDLGDVPRVSNAGLDDEDPAHPLLQWKIDGDTSRAHAIVMQVSWPITKDHVWTIIAPPTTKPGFQLPELPPELASEMPKRGALAGVALVESSEYSGYADVKKKWIHLLSELPEEDGTLRLSLTGHIDF